MSKWISIQSFPNRIDAELAKSLLTSFGIQAMTQPDDAGGVYPSLSLVAGVRLLVPENQAEEATRLLGKQQ